MPPPFPLRTNRMLLGNRVFAVGVAGSIFTDECGDRDILVDAAGVDTVSRLFVDAEDAFECVRAWWMLRIEDTDDEVDLRPRSPADDRRYELRGVWGAGDSELRCDPRLVRVYELRWCAYDAPLGVRLLALDDRFTVVGVGKSMRPGLVACSCFLLASWFLSGQDFSRRSFSDGPAPILGVRG